MESGIYFIKNILNGKCYVGSSKKLKNRFNQHFNALRNNKHHSKKLQNAFNKYGEKNFKFGILEYVNNINMLIEREQYWIDKLDSYNTGYNCTSIAGKLPDNSGSNNGMYGKIPWNKGLPKYKQPVYGRFRTEEEKKNISIKNSGSNNGMYGKIPSNAIKVRCIETNTIYNSLLEASMSMGYKSDNAIREHLRGTKELFCNYHWQRIDK